MATFTVLVFRNYFETRKQASWLSTESDNTIQSRDQIYFKEFIGWGTGTGVQDLLKRIYRLTDYS